MSSTPAQLPEADFEATRSILLAWRADGVPRPLLPVYRDEDGDGVPDFYGLDDADQVVLVSGATLTQSVARSTGDGAEGGGDE
ncbi:hypothetical protein SK224_16450 [Microbacterium sp. BG28]|uniref:hypothetical protein n=1 Tax=Microbacterium sp. BG28 TaxID=3097356 RepID=UPI002A5A7C6A|nr:hypothetical protein [Microbacterium sp. BG28]MDY0830727.1 hypothetical protein [Microbacterium sp. BG28]